MTPSIYSVILSVAKDLTYFRLGGEILHFVQDDEPRGVIGSAAKDLNMESNAREILRCAQDHEICFEMVAKEMI